MKLRYLSLALFAVLLTGCYNTNTESYEYVISVLTEDGYLEEDQELYVPVINEISAAIPQLMAKNYVYEDEDGELFCVRILTIEEDDEEYEAQIIKDFELITYHHEDRTSYEIAGSYEIVEKITIPAP